MKTNIIVAFLALSPIFGYVLLSSCTPSTASYGPIKRDANGHQYSESPVPATKPDSIEIERARFMVSAILAIDTPRP